MGGAGALASQDEAGRNVLIQTEPCPVWRGAPSECFSILTSSPSLAGSLQ
jgi:hypothetical protein